MMVRDESGRGVGGGGGAYRADEQGERDGLGGARHDGDVLVCFVSFGRCGVRGSVGLMNGTRSSLCGGCNFGRWTTSRVGSKCRDSGQF